MEKLKSFVVASLSMLTVKERKTEVTTNPCFTLDEVIKKLVDKDQDLDVTEVVLQCGFNLIQVGVFWNHIG